MTDGARCLRVLVADDNRDAADMLASLLILLGHTTTTVYDGLAATEEALAGDYDVIVLDINMPVRSGLEAAKLIRLHFGATASPRLIALTALGSARDRRASLEAGFHAHLVKPISSQQLVDVMWWARNDAQP